MEPQSLRDRVTEGMKEAMKARDELRLSALRMLRAAFLVKDKEGKGAVSEEDLVGVVRSLIKQRHESAAAFRQAGREESAAKEEQEAVILQELLPPALEGEALLDLIRQIVGETGATTLKDMGRVVKLLKEKSGGRVDMSKASEIVKQVLTNG
ncbi:MAG: GatB/YqeY domain-containing protein [Magnetococcales bacterium]|nr:GatB/YqeY domain-containing protein [Magnetococcales bacterium]NGZ28629.1 GatB/YqeY domain-containing protein [Magnetococcales bacterium]